MLTVVCSYCPYENKITHMYLDELYLHKDLIIDLIVVGYEIMQLKMLVQEQ